MLLFGAQHPMHFLQSLQPFFQYSFLPFSHLSPFILFVIDLIRTLYTNFRMFSTLTDRKVVILNKMVKFRYFVKKLHV